MILIKPLITEKMTELHEKRQQYGFIVDRRANKVEIKRELEKFYDVEIDRVNTMIYRGKNKTNRRTGQVNGRNITYKKVIFTLKDGHTIDFFDNI